MTEGLRCIVCGKKLEPFEFGWCTDCNPYRICVSKKEIGKILQGKKEEMTLKLLGDVFTPRYDNRFIPRSDRQMHFLDIKKKRII